ncbi:hypothetical protein BBG06_02655 [Streptococcus dysgalactiae subsp. equisimilis]|uniref:hypothetical protein n=1 Tax=Streptococcus dysgalactiae TaxID=1334 RepID=UPI000806FFD1|nr:hypothetical protein [Streptococcus dysgalactiae]MCL6221879.1 hypothetical protein [Streptococcus dysgalactiae subsp. equisimilis]OBY97326.1 hypothetical protein BBG06_02655 [Streptococcus dysgalactiae subsp. equisimilis]UMY68636.1 hypothetical protein ML603_02765 [Streptococcus dysgalactiae subsp. equisimilis]
MKKVMLAIMATLTLAGLLSSTIVSANTQNFGYLSREEMSRRLKELREARQGRSIVSTVEKKRNEVINDIDKGFEDLTVKEKDDFITRAKNSDTVKALEEIFKEAVDRVVAKTNLYNKYAELLRSGYRDSVTIDKSELRLYDYQNLKEIVEHLTK